MEETAKKEEEKVVNASEIIEKIISLTFSRHADLTEQEFLDKIGYGETGLAEEEAVRKCIFALCSAITKEVFKLENTLKFIQEYISLLEKKGKKENG